MRNPALKQRHWVQVENVLNFKFKADQVITLELLENLNVFSYPNELMEISGQASSEAGLESLLRRVSKDFRYIISTDLFFIIGRRCLEISGVYSYTAQGFERCIYPGLHGRSSSCA